MGDTLTLVGGTFTTVCTLTVLTIDAETGSVLTVAVANGGNYTVFPGPAGVATTGINGVGATFNIVNVGTAVTTATVVAGGGPWPAGYRVGDVCQLEGGVFSAPASVRVTATTSGQVAGIEIVTGGVYTVEPCSPTPVFGGHGCGLKVTCTFTAGVVTAVIVADMGGSCWKPRKRWWQVTEIYVFAPGEGPGDDPKAKVCGKMLNPPEKCWDVLFDFCGEGMTNRPVTKLWLPVDTDVTGQCCEGETIHDGDVIELPAKSGRLYDVLYAEYMDLDQRCQCRGSCCCTVPGERLFVVVKQQCPFGPVEPSYWGNYWSSHYWNNSYWS